MGLPAGDVNMPSPKYDPDKNAPKEVKAPEKPEEKPEPAESVE